MSKLTFAERAWEEYLYWQENDKKTLKYTDNLVAHCFFAVGVEMNLNPIGRFADTPHKVGLFGSSRCCGAFICIHIDFLVRIIQIQRYLAG
jgi:hypothetical protein